jgi:hypothetical protein
MAHHINRSYLALTNVYNGNYKSEERSNVRAIAQDKIYGFAYCSVYAFYCTFCNYDCNDSLHFQQFIVI